MGENTSAHDIDVICEQLRRDNNLASAQADKCFTPEFRTRNEKNYAGSIVAFDMRTGKVTWVRKLTGGAPFKFEPATRVLGGFYDVFSFACPAGPNLFPDNLVSAIKLDTFFERCPTVQDDGTGYHIIPGNRAGVGTIVQGNDYDFGQSPALITLKDHTSGEPKQLLVAGQKSGILLAMNPDKSGEIVWILNKEELGYGGKLGGFAFGLASDGERVYVSASMSRNQAFLIVSQFPPFNIIGLSNTLASDSPYFSQVGGPLTAEAFQITNPVPESLDLSQYGDTVNAPARIFIGTGVETCYNTTDNKCAAGQLATYGGIWSAVDLRTGKTVWQRPDPNAPFFDNTVMTYANGLLFVTAKGPIPDRAAGTGRVYILNAKTGNVLQRIDTDWVTTRPSISKNKVLWPLGYYGETTRAPNTKMMVLELNKD